MITKDNVTSTVDAVAYFQVVDPEASVIRIRDWYSSSQLVAQTTLRSIVGRHELDQLLTERDRIDAELQIALDAQTESWGIKVHRVEIRDVQVPEQLQRAMARQAEAERERRAKIIAAEGELQASQKLGEAAAVLSSAPGALQLRQLQTMVEISAENSSTIVFPIPVQLLEALSAMAGRRLAPLRGVRHPRRGLIKGAFGSLACRILGLRRRRHPRPATGGSRPAARRRRAASSATSNVGFPDGSPA